MGEILTVFFDECFSLIRQVYIFVLVFAVVLSRLFIWNVENSSFWAVVILKHLFCLSAGLFSIWTQLLAFCFDWQLAPAGLLSDLNTDNKDWHRLNLLTNSRHTNPETQTQIWNWLRLQPHCTPNCTLPTNSTLLAAAPDASTNDTLQQPSHDTMCKKCYWRYFKKLPNQDSIDILMKTLKTVLVCNPVQREFRP